MTRRTLILLVAFFVMVGFYLYDRDNSSQTVLPAAVLSVDSRDLSEGAESWLITVQIDGKTIALEPLQARPNLTAGDTLCVTRIIRIGSGDEYRRTTGNAVC